MKNLAKNHTNSPSIAGQGRTLIGCGTLTAPFTSSHPPTRNQNRYTLSATEQKWI
jgi:hypothetical protein